MNVVTAWTTSVWRFPHDARYAPITEGEVRRMVLHDRFLWGLRGSLAHASLHRILLCVGPIHCQGDGLSAQLAGRTRLPANL